LRFKGFAISLSIIYFIGDISNILILMAKTSMVGLTVRLLSLPSYGDVLVGGLINE